MATNDVRADDVRADDVRADDIAMISNVRADDADGCGRQQF